MPELGVIARAPLVIAAVRAEHGQLVNDGLVLSGQFPCLFEGISGAIEESAALVVPAEFEPGARLEGLVQAGADDKTIPDLHRAFEVALRAIEIAEREVDFHQVRIVFDHLAERLDGREGILNGGRAEAVALSNERGGPIGRPTATL